MRPLVWFRSDLRIRDNTALWEACRTADDGVAAVFTICADQWAAHDWAPIRVDFLLRNLADLSRSLRTIQVPLLIVEEPRFSGVPRRLLSLADRLGCSGIWFNREYEINERRRDREVVRVFEAAGKPAHMFADQTVVGPRHLRRSQGKYYSVFTPYKNQWLAALEERGGIRVNPIPPEQPPLAIGPDEVPAGIQGFEGLKRPDLWESGELQALRRLRVFVEERLESYHERRDLPGADGTSTLSPYLSVGLLSPRQCLSAALEANNGLLETGAEGVTTWISELIWREFYRHVLLGFPRVSMHQPFDLRTERIRWREDEGAFERWTDGRTGIPIVDAGMRQMAETGWMHNRLRMITAMFLTKNLFIDWRRGEQHFMRHLVDGDLANNNGGWQWSASVGTDAAPYFRVFNPVRQSERFDPDGTFIRRFVPELKNVPSPEIHLPGERAPEVCASTGYPLPMVDVRRSRKIAIERFKKAISPDVS